MHGRRNRPPSLVIEAGEGVFDPGGERRIEEPLLLTGRRKISQVPQAKYLFLFDLLPGKRKGTVKEEKALQRRLLRREGLFSVRERKKMNPSAHQRKRGDSGQKKECGKG